MVSFSRAALLRVAALLPPLLAAGTVSAQSAPDYAARLGPTPINDATRAKVRGAAKVTATVAGSRLSVTGVFSGLAGPATTAELRGGAGIGVPGPVVAPLTITAAPAGQVSGSVALNGAQLQALHKGYLYIQINSQSVPDGNLWGWLLPPSGIPAAAR